MKQSLKLLFPTLALGGVLSLGVGVLPADEIKFSDLEKKIAVDKSPVASEGGLVTSYAPALKKVMPSVVTIFSSKSEKSGS